MGRFSLLAVIFCISLPFLWGQTGQEQDSPEAEDILQSEMQETDDKPAPFPLGLILMTALQKTVSWQPDWALAIPPDAFKVSSGEPASITLNLEGKTYRIRWDKKGALAEFPLLLQGLLVQVETIFGVPGTIQGFVIHSGSDLSWRIDFIGNKDAPLSVARVTQSQEVYFVALRYAPTDAAETWYDQDGKRLADFTSLFCYMGEDPQIFTLTSRYEGEETIAWYYYDSFGNISAIHGSEGMFSALYSQKHYPRYWKRQALDSSESPDIAGALQSYALQWDGQGFLVRISETSAGDHEDRLDLRYEYTLDAQGNWTERREIRMIHQLSGLTPSPGLTVKRIITY